MHDDEQDGPVHAVVSPTSPAKVVQEHQEVEVDTPSRPPLSDALTATDTAITKQLQSDLKAIEGVLARIISERWPERDGKDSKFKVQQSEMTYDAYDR